MKDKQLQKLLDQLDFAFGESAEGEEIPCPPFDLEALRRRVESRSPEEVAQILAEIDELRKRP